MRAPFIALALFFALFAASVTAATAQVIINQAALDQLAGIPPAVISAPPQSSQPLRKIIYRPVIHHHVVEPQLTAGQTISKILSKPPLAAKPAVPPAQTAPQAQLAVAKPVTPKLAPKLAPPPNIEITFAAGVSDLPPGIIAQLKPFCADLAPTGPITIDAYAAADPADPSAAPRLSLARAFALRDALMACGIPSSSIIPRADGPGKNPNIARISVAP